MLKITWSERRGGTHPGLVGTAESHPNLIFRKDDNGKIYYEPTSEAQLALDIAASEQRSFGKNADRLKSTAEARYLRSARERCAEIDRELRQVAGRGGYEIPAIS